MTAFNFYSCEDLKFFSAFRLLPLKRAVLLLLAALVLTSAACGMLSDDDNGDPGAGEVRVTQALMGTAINDEQQVLGQAGRAFPADTSEVYAVVVLDGAGTGDRITGRWFQLSVPDVPPEGLFVTEASVTLTEEHLTEDGSARVSLRLASEQGPLPIGDWLVRIHANDVFVRTMGFVLTDELAGAPGQGTPAPQASPEGTPASTGSPAAAGTATPSGTTSPGGTTPPAGTAAPTGTTATRTTPGTGSTYTVQPGDTLIAIAEQFRGDDETNNEFIERLLELNDLEPDAIIFPDQELQLPPPQ